MDIFFGFFWVQIKTRTATDAMTATVILNHGSAWRRRQWSCWRRCGSDDARMLFSHGAMEAEKRSYVASDDGGSCCSGACTPSFLYCSFYLFLCLFFFFSFDDGSSDCRCECQAMAVDASGRRCFFLRPTTIAASLFLFTLFFFFARVWVSAKGVRWF